MLDSTAPIPLEYELPGQAYYHLVRTLRLTLPPPLTGSAEDLLQRDQAAITRIAAFAPGNSAEADFAAQYVAATEQWKDCQRLVREPETTPEMAMKYRAQAATMMREATGPMRMLLRMQEARRKLEADNVACDRAARAELCATRLMAEAMSRHPDGSAGAFGPPASAQGTNSAGVSGSTASAPPAEPHPAPAGATPAQDRDPPPGPAAEPEPAPVAAAGQHAAAHPERAAPARTPNTANTPAAPAPVPNPGPPETRAA